MITTSGALAHVKKTYYFIENLADKNGALYSSTKRSLQEIITTCKDIIEVAEDILDRPGRGQSYSSSQEEVKPDIRCPSQQAVHRHFQNSNSNLESRVQEVEDKMSSMSDNINQILAILRENPKEPNIPKDITSNIDSGTSSNNVPDSSPDNSKRDENRMWVSKFDDNLHTMNFNITKDKHAHIDIQNIGSVLCNWYQERILKLDKSTSKFRYHVSNILDYIRAIVCSYARSADKSRWVSLFNIWIDKLKNNDSSVSSYALPYDIYNVYTEVKNRDYKWKLDEGILWLDLLDHGLDDILIYDRTRFSYPALTDTDGKEVTIREYRRRQMES